MKPPTAPAGPPPPPSISCSPPARCRAGTGSTRQRPGTGTRAQPLALTIADAAGRREVWLGADLAAGERPQAVVPAGAWQQAESLGEWTLVGCTVAPGFQFAGFELAAPGFEPA